MFKSIATHELDALIAAVADCGDHSAIAGLVPRFPDIPRQSLRRRLSRLLADGRMRASGARPARRYLEADASVVTAGDARIGPHRVTAQAADDYMSITAGAAELRWLIGQPLSRRALVGYDRAFWGRYICNQTYYSAGTPRAQLHELRHAPVHGQPVGTNAWQVLDRLLMDLSRASNRRAGG